MNWLYELFEGLWFGLRVVTALIVCVTAGFAVLWALALGMNLGVS